MCTENEKTALLLIVFGTTVARGEKAYDMLECRIRTAYPELPFHMAYCSPYIIGELRKAGRVVQSPPEILDGFVSEGIETVFTFPAYLAMGEEFSKIEFLLNDYKKKLNIVYALPPLATPSNLRRFVSALMLTVPERFESGRALLFMGHGHADGRSDFAYAALERALQARNENVFVACVEGGLSLENAIEKMEKNGIRHITLRPLMIVAGEHAVNDLAGAGEDSWKSRLSAAGFSANEELKGLCEYPEIADYFAESLKNEKR